MSRGGPSLFLDIGKRARDILYKDYCYDRKFSVTTHTQDGFALTSSILQRGHSIGDLAAQFKYKNAIIDVKADTQSTIATTLTLNDVMPSLKSIASVKLPNYNSAKGMPNCLGDDEFWCWRNLITNDKLHGWGHERSIRSNLSALIHQWKPNP